VKTSGKVLASRLLQSMSLLSMACSNGDIVEKAEAHGSIARCMVAWGPYQSKTLGCLASPIRSCHTIHQGQSNANALRRLLAALHVMIQCNQVHASLHNRQKCISTLSASS